MSDLEDDDGMEPLLDAEDDGHDNKSTNAPEKCVRCQLDVPVLVWCCLGLAWAFSIKWT